ncbi:MAG: HDIG domain-containing protein [Candidatus Latescibacteria bacterium]|nr:HDIG domain-containing protein [Candidatus Latescibacterota bacterium]NIO28411.1 HDIG domain-containing protein [Candidatus Latescibacterota bacterium]NIO55960.1 HDIG domain-containing protein [Candidatus Latescibacterota bacterium]NIT01924.1 HDIG domain-containing protein [Candidatus Latescibacterota bacterium]
MNKEIIETVPEFDLIKDSDLRKRILSVWEEALSTGDFTIEEMKRIPFTLLADNVKVSFLEHVRTVCRLCDAMAEVLIDMYGERVKINRDHLIAGALLADIGKMIEFEKKSDGSLIKGHRGDMLRHPFTGVGMCFKAGIPYEVMHIVAVHSKEGDHVKRSPEAIIFHHADFTDFDLVK